MAARRRALASAAGSPTTFGTTAAGASPVLIQIVTVVPGIVRTPPSGVCSATVPAGRYESTDRTATLKRASRKASRAAPSVNPITRGTATSSGTGKSIGSYGPITFCM